MPHVNPELLTWARKTADLSLEEAAAALQLGGRRKSGIEALQQYEDGVLEPSRSLLIKMAKTYRRPLLAFYLPHPPKVAEKGEDFRTLPPDRKQESAAQLDALVRDIHVRQGLVRSAIEEVDEALPLGFVQSITLQQGVNEVARLVRQRLDFDLQTFRRTSNVGDSFNYLRGKVEDTGVFVLLIGNLGSHHSSLSADVFRGFALADPVAPFIVINDQDAKSAWAFTLLHELVHIWLGKTGISGGGYDQQIERFCNDVASELLLPNEEFAAWHFDAADMVGQVAQINEFAKDRKISRSLIAYRLYLAQRISQAAWIELTKEFHDMWMAEKVAERLRQNPESSGPSYYVVRRHRVGGALLNFVRRTLAEGILTPTKAGKVLGVRPMNVEPLLASPSR